jgi:transposase
VYTVAQQLGIPPGTLARWIPKADDKAKAPAQGPQDVQAELQRLRKEVAELRMERDILKKATAYFAKESLQGTHS